MAGKPNPHKDRQELREEALRPSRHLGYGRDTLALYLISRRAYALAEPELRRAVWLNPYEPAFKVHLAWCLYKQQKFQEAREWIDQAIQQNPDNPEGQRVRAAILDGCRPESTEHG